MPNLPIRNEAEWHEYRSRHVGGSEVAALFSQWYVPGQGAVTVHLYEPVPDNAVAIGGLGYVSGHRLWLEKSGKLAPEDIGGFDRVQAGQHLEVGIASWAGERWPEMRLRKVRRYMTHPTVAGFGSSLDYESHVAGTPPVEIKLVDGIIFKQQWGVDETTGELIQLPLKFLLQLQAQIAVSNSDHGWLIVCVGGNKLHRVRVERHQPTIDRIIEAVNAFWAGVERGVFLEHHLDYEAQAEVAKFGSADAANEIVDLGDDQRVEMWVRMLLRWREHAKRVDTHVDALKGRVAARFGEDATMAITHNLTIKWPRVTVPEREVPATVRKGYTYRGAISVSKPRAGKGKSK